MFKFSSYILSSPPLIFSFFKGVFGDKIEKVLSLCSTISVKSGTSFLSLLQSVETEHRSVNTGCSHLSQKQTLGWLTEKLHLEAVLGPFDF